MQLELRHLRTLRTVRDHGSLNRAAAALGVSQPALTNQLKRIEESLGGAVFRRGTRGVEPTPYGEFILAKARTALSAFDDILAAHPDETPVRAVRLGTVASPMALDLADRLGFLLSGAPVTVRTEGAVRTLLEMVAGQQLECAVVGDYPGYDARPEPPVEYRLIAVEPVFIAVGAQHPLAARDEVDLDELAEETWVLPPSDGMGWPEHLVDTCEARGFTPRVRYRLVDNSLRRELIATGRAVSPVQPTFRTDAGITVRPIKGDPMWMRYHLVWHGKGPLAPYGDELVRLAQQSYTATMENASGYLAWAARRGGMAGNGTE
ncbi:LysR family transcriptional regulator [Streptomyces sp. NBC_00554]|uniref:LysR family transcriptional regulator n=1 Tax=unclassified Streptomyces TaxID=2593676 RepID=UPI00352EB467|nr:LysR family transcriptional regulator [Streptomyces sp. NBC_00564]WUC48184.1 LysR family transcriptional regulator [Streptomyces sp. NBC_00554]